MLTVHICVYIRFNTFLQSMTYLINDWIDESLLYFCFCCVKPLYLMLLFCVVSFHRATGAIFRSLDHFLCLNMHKKSKSKLNSIRMVNKNHAKKIWKTCHFLSLSSSPPPPCCVCGVLFVCHCCCNAVAFVYLEMCQCWFSKYKTIFV